MLLELGKLKFPGTQTFDQIVADISTPNRRIEARKAVNFIVLVYPLLKFGFQLGHGLENISSVLGGEQLAKNSLDFIA